MDVISELGTDFNSSWNFVDGDLKIVTNDENLVQATKNRLNTQLDSVNYFYSDYGSILHRFLGWRKNKTTLKFMQIALTNCLSQDPRFADFDVDLELAANGRVIINIHVIFDEDTELDINYLLNTDGTVEEI